MLIDGLVFWFFQSRSSPMEDPVTLWVRQLLLFLQCVILIRLTSSTEGQAAVAVPASYSNSVVSRLVHA